MQINANPITPNVSVAQSVSNPKRIPVSTNPNTSFATMLADISKHREQIARDVTLAQNSMRDAEGIRLLRLQESIHQYSFQIDLISRVVDKSVSAIKTVMNIQG